MSSSTAAHRHVFVQRHREWQIWGPSAESSLVRDVSILRCHVCQASVYWHVSGALLLEHVGPDPGWVCCDTLADLMAHVRDEHFAKVLAALTEETP